MFQAAHHRLHESYRGWVLRGIGVRVQARVPSPLLVGEVQLREQRSYLDRPHAVLVAKVVELHPQTQAAVNARTHVGEEMEFSGRVRGERIDILWAGRLGTTAVYQRPRRKRTESKNVGFRFIHFVGSFVGCPIRVAVEHERDDGRDI